MLTRWKSEDNLIYKLNHRGVNSDEIKIRQTDDTTGLNSFIRIVLNDIDDYIYENTEYSIKFMSDNWGMGQININTIRLLVYFGLKENMKFQFFKEVTAMNDISGHESTVKANDTHLFVYNDNYLKINTIWKKIDYMK